jgi:uncharacterized protein with HEPN domain
MSNKERIILTKMISEIHMANSMLAGFSKDDFLRDEKTQRAICMTLINLGELAKALSTEFRKQHADLPWRAVTGLRDIVAHKYQTIRMDDIWVTCQADIPILLRLLEGVVRQ